MLPILANGADLSTGRLITLTLIPIVLSSLILPTIFIVLPMIARRRIRLGKAHGVGYLLSQHDLQIFLQGWQRLSAFKKSVTIPLSNITQVRHDERTAHADPHGIKWGGSYFPGVITAGTFKECKHYEFWYITDPRKAVVIDLTGHKYARVVVEMDEPDRFVQEVIDHQHAHS